MSQVKFENNMLRHADGTVVEIGTLLRCVEKRHPLKKTRMTYLGLMRVNKDPPTATASCKTHASRCPHLATNMRRCALMV